MSKFGDENSKYHIQNYPPHSNETQESGKVCPPISNDEPELLTKEEKEYIKDLANTPRSNYLVMYDPCVHGVATAESLVEAANIIDAYISTGHKDVALYERVSPKSDLSCAIENFTKVSKTIIKPDDPVNHPKHYTFGKFEVIDVLQDWFPTNPLLWQVCKYVARALHKGQYIQDLEKARFYLEREIENAKNA